jgi:hypothetical protein
MAMLQRSSAAYELLDQIVTLPSRILSSEVIEKPDFSSQRLRCKILRDDVEDGALAVIFAPGVLSFHDAPPRQLPHRLRRSRRVDPGLSFPASVPGKSPSASTPTTCGAG